ncbi:MAG TPA: hypothetical protein PKJ03_07880, partial [Methanoregulaceae archaeon]|nr:hypothetical protein [Methanoregulaceae archaeon]
MAVKESEKTSSLKNFFSIAKKGEETEKGKNEGASNDFKETDEDSKFFENIITAGEVPENNTKNPDFSEDSSIRNRVILPGHSSMNGMQSESPGVESVVGGRPVVRPGPRGER